MGLLKLSWFFAKSNWWDVSLFWPQATWNRFVTSLGTKDYSNRYFHRQKSAVMEVGPTISCPAVMFHSDARIHNLVWNWLGSSYLTWSLVKGIVSPPRLPFPCQWPLIRCSMHSEGVTSSVTRPWSLSDLSTNKESSSLNSSTHTSTSNPACCTQQMLHFTLLKKSSADI